MTTKPKTKRTESEEWWMVVSRKTSRGVSAYPTFQEAIGNASLSGGHGAYFIMPVFVSLPERPARTSSKNPKR